MIINGEQITIVSSITEKNVYYIIRPYKEKDSRVERHHYGWRCSDKLTLEETKILNEYINNRIKFKKK